MKPLREHLHDPDATLRAGAALLAKVPPLELSTAQRRRIRARIDAASEAPRGLRWLRPAFALPVLLVVGVASAALGPRLYRAVMPQRELEAAPALPAAPSPPPRAATPKPASAPAAPAEPDSITPEDLAPEKPSPTPAARAAESGPGAALMMEALQARRAGDAARAQRLTAEYQKKYPNGSLKEEALALSIEAAAARKDPSAVTLAQKYLASFPHGRFRAQAEQVLANQ